jgi:hypothetical protein
MKITRVGLDLAKRVFQVHGVNEHGAAKLSKKLSRAEVLQFFAQLPPCTVGIEACGGAHYWGRQLGKLGHTVRLMAAQFVNPYRKSGKNDANDAEAICEAVGRANMRFVSVKSEEQQAVLMMHRARTLVVSNRTAQVNQIRGLLGEFGLIVPVGIKRLRTQLPQILEMPRTACRSWPGKFLPICCTSCITWMSRSNATIGSLNSWPARASRLDGSWHSMASGRSPPPHSWRAWVTRRCSKTAVSSQPGSG